MTLVISVVTPDRHRQRRIPRWHRKLVNCPAPQKKESLRRETEDKAIDAPTLGTMVR